MFELLSYKRRLEHRVGNFEFEIDLEVWLTQATPDDLIQAHFLPEKREDFSLVNLLH